MTSLPSPPLTLDEIEEELHDCDTSHERLEYLIELGATLPALPTEVCTEANRVLGCQSMVWLVSQILQGKIYIEATSDAPMVRGLIAILLAAYSGKSPQAILDFDIEEFFERIQLRSFITPMRSNGLHSMVVRVQSIAKEENLAVGGATTNSNPAQSVNSPQPYRDLLTIRDDFPILNRIHTSGKKLVYLDNAASSQRPSQVVDSMSKVYCEHYSNVHRAGHELASETTIAMERARKSIARFVHAPDARQIIFTSGTTSAINLVARTWGDDNVGVGDEIVLSEMEHHSNIVPWQQLARRTGAIIRWLPIGSDYQLDLDCFAKMITSRVKLVAVTAVSNVLGTINPIRKIHELAKAKGACLLVDAAQSIPHAGVDVQAIDADFLVFSGHKMLGPTGIGVLYGKQEVLEAMPPFLGGGNMIHSVDFNGFTPAGIPHRFEAGTAPIVEAIAMHEAVSYLESIGGEAILEHEQSLVAATHARLEKLTRIKIFGPSPDKKTGIFTFNIDGLHPDEAGRRLDAEGIAVRVGHHCAMPLHQKLGVSATCRASFYLYNNLEEVDRFCKVIEAIAK
jgi:cysteine desulfurase / selenocysteine lyase